LSGLVYTILETRNDPEILFLLHIALLTILAADHFFDRQTAAVRVY